MDFNVSELAGEDMVLLLQAMESEEDLYQIDFCSSPAQCTCDGNVSGCFTQLSL